MAQHLAEHSEYEDLNVRLATAYFNTKGSVTTMRSNSYKIGKPAAGKRQRKSAEQAKAAKSPKTDASLTAALAEALQIIAAKEKQNDKLQASVESLAASVAKQTEVQDKREENQAKFLNQNQQLMDITLKGSPSNHGTLDQAAETVRVMKAFCSRVSELSEGGMS